MEDPENQDEAPSDKSSALTVSAVLKISSASRARNLYEAHIPLAKRVPEKFWDGYTAKERLCGLKAVLALFLVSDGQLVPREFQLKATIALCTGRDALVDVGTGYGKTFCMILPALLSPKSISLVVSPLKKLQEMQVLEFRKHGVSALAINEDTPKDKELWKDIAKGQYRVLVVQAEQFFIDNGHWPRLARLLNVRDFVKLIKYFLVDEAHSIYTLGMDLYGDTAFRPAWRYLAELRTKLGSKVAVAALSGTLPKHIKGVVKERLQFDDDRLCSLKLTCNRPNIAYALHEVFKDLSDYRNLDFLLSEETGAPLEGRQRRKGIVFHDSIDGAIAAKVFQDSRLSPERRGKGIIRHYNAQMSAEYLQKVYDDFRDPNGRCEILHATEAASTGLDIRDICWVVQYGLPREMTITQQRGGRCGRDGVTPSIYLIMYESWTSEVDLTAALDEERTSNGNLDPDRPICGKITDKTKKRDRTGVSMLKLVQHPHECIRKVFADSNNDTASDGPYCCNSSEHPNSSLDFGFYFPGKLLYEDRNTGIIYAGAPTDPNRQVVEAPTGQKRGNGSLGSNTYREIAQRKSLASRLAKWRYDSWTRDKFRFMRPQYLILSDKGIDALAKIHPSNLVNSKQVQLVVDETEQWGEKWGKGILGVVQQFDREVLELEEQARVENEERRKRQKLEKSEQEAVEKRIKAQNDFLQDSKQRYQMHSQRVPNLSINDARLRLAELNKVGNSTFGAPKQIIDARAFEVDTDRIRKEVEERVRLQMRQR